MNENIIQRSIPNWLVKETGIDEPVFCQQFLDKYPMICIHGKFYTVDGIISDESKLKKKIYDELCTWIKSKVSKKVDDILGALRLFAYEESFPLQMDRVHVANGTWFLDGSFTNKKEYCRNRLVVEFHHQPKPPIQWILFLKQLLNPEDIETLQEYLGYCLLPTTKGQKMMVIVGKGGERKSRIGIVMNALLGTNMVINSINKIETNKFSRADLDGALLMVDDDMDMNALPKTNYIKSIVTAECMIDVERKGVQSYQSLLYSRFLCFSNGRLTALHDRSDGFFRRQIVLTTKDRPADRVDDPYLIEKLLEEKEGILLWCLQGLQRLVGNNYHFTISDSAKANVQTAVKEANNVLSFLTSEGYIEFNLRGGSSTKDLYRAYKQWCEDNLEFNLSSNSFSQALANYADQFHLEQTNNIYIGNEKRCRGYLGINVITPLV